MIRQLSELTLDGALATLYAGIAAAVSAGCVLGVAIVWLGTAARAGRGG